MDPIQAANIVLTVWDLLHRVADGPDRTPDREGRPPQQERLDRDAFERDYVAIQERTDRLVLVTHAMWALMAEKMGITEADLLKRLTELDAADGTVDGQVTAAPVRCSCGAMICRKMNRCLFCGKAYQGGSTFDTL
jgi:hypothetical protein